MTRTCPYVVILSGPGHQAGKLALQRRQLGVAEVVADQVRRQIRSPGVAVRRLIFAATIAGSHGRMMPSACSRSSAVRTVRSDRSL